VGEQRIGDTVIPDGGWVLIAIASANRDEQQLGDGDFDENRDMRGAPHLTFGLGIHACIGQQLARREALITVEGLLDRIPAPCLDPQGTPEPLDILDGDRLPPPPGGDVVKVFIDRREGLHRLVGLAVDPDQQPAAVQFIEVLADIGVGARAGCGDRGVLGRGHHVLFPARVSCAAFL
jgi:hypothetical protein